MSKVLVEYVGLKPSETDHLYGTNIVWIGQGDVQEVPAEAWEKMKKHVDVWRELPTDIEYALSLEHSAALRAEADQIPTKTETAVAESFGDMSDEQVRAYVEKTTAKKLHHKLTGDKLRARAIEVLKGE